MLKGRKGKRMDSLPQMKNEKSYSTFFCLLIKISLCCSLCYVLNYKMRHTYWYLEIFKLLLPSSSFTLGKFQGIWMDAKKVAMVWYFEEPGLSCSAYLKKLHHNLLLSIAGSTKSNRTTLHIVCLTSFICLWENAELQGLWSNCKGKRLASH